jgi:hypothetical protein
MSDLSSNLALPYLSPSQAQKHVTHNEALQILDAVVQLAVASCDIGTPPAVVDAGARYIVGPNATGDWSGEETHVALWSGSGWIFIAPQEGWQAWVTDKDAVVVWHDSQWQAPGDLTDVSLVGVNTTADVTNRLAVSAPATLLNHEGAGHQLKINKAAQTDTASLLFQTGFSGRAEMGLAGGDDWSVKVSADGASWTQALALDPASGLASGAAVQSGRQDATAGRLMTVGAFGLGGTSVAVPLDDVNAIENNGMYYADLAAINKPTANVLVAALMRTSSIGAQLAFARDAANSGRLFNRAKVAGVWSDWYEVFTQHSILGDVSQTAGTPTGAVIERGSNSNGHYVRFADGTQICSTDITGVDVTTAVGGLFSSGALVWNFPAAFSDGSWSGGGRITNSAAGLAVHLGGSGLTMSSPVTAYGTSSLTGRTLGIFAIGRWF